MLINWLHNNTARLKSLRPKTKTSRETKTMQSLPKHVKLIKLYDWLMNYFYRTLFITLWGCLKIKIPFHHHRDSHYKGHLIFIMKIPIPVSTGTCFTKFLWGHDPNFVKSQVNLSWKIIIQSSHNFAHVTTAQLSWHVQNYDLIGSLQSKL